MFLTVADLEHLTGLQRPSAQARWLKRHGWRFTVNGLGRPVVAVAEANRHLVGGKAAHQEPDYRACHG